MHVWDKEQTRKQKKNKKERSRVWVPNPATMYYLVVSYDQHGSYSGPILKYPNILELNIHFLNYFFRENIFFTNFA